MKKIRLRSPLDRLPLHIKQQLAAWLTTGGQHGQGMTYAEARQKLLSEFGVSASVSALCGYFQRNARPDPRPLIVAPDSARVAQLAREPEVNAMIVPMIGANRQPKVKVKTFRSSKGDTLTIVININQGNSAP